MDTDNFISLLQDGNDDIFAVMGDELEPPMKRGKYEILYQEKENDTATPISGNVDEVMTCLNKKFGITAFRGEQEAVIRATLSGHDCLVIMATGQGKSLCYEVPAALSDGVTVVVSPLKALMFEQSVKMIKIGVVAAAITEGCSSARIYSDLRKQQPDIKLLYVTPEMLVHSKVLKNTLDELNKRRRLSRFVFDEAHCMESWGRDFRPEYRKLMWVHNSYPNVPFMALTATASLSTRLEIERLLGLKNTKRFITSINRPNLMFTVLPKDKNYVMKMADIVKDEYPESCGIIYCMTRKDCESISLQLTTEQISCAVYHAGLPKQLLESAHSDWLKGDVKVMVATNAFGMGIDKPDVRFVFHSSAPKSVQDYFQECGRAGRDGLKSKCILFYKFEDCISRFSLSEGLSDRNTSTDQQGKNMVKYATNVIDCRRTQLLSHFGEESQSMCSSSCCDNHLNQVKYESKDITKETRGVVNMLMPKYLKMTVKQFKDVLKGSKQKTLINRGFTNLRHHGMMAQWKQNDVQNFVATLFVNDVLALKQEQSTYGVTNYVTLGRNQSCFTDSFQLELQVLAKKRNNIFNECLEKLVSVVDAFSFALGIEKNSIFDIKVLTNIALKMPTTASQMMKVPGVTVGKYRQYGEPLLDVTRAVRFQNSTL